MKLLPIVLAAVLVLGTAVVAQETTQEKPRQHRQPTVEVQKGPRMQRGEFKNCPQCQKHMKHMQQAHGRQFRGGDRAEFRGQGRGPRGPAAFQGHGMGPRGPMRPEGKPQGEKPEKVEAEK